MKLPEPQSPQPSDNPGAGAEEPSPADKVQEQIAGISDTLGQMTAARKVDAEAKAAAAEEKKVAEDADRQAELKAEADLKALLEPGEVDDPNKPAGSKLNDLDNTQLLDVVATAVETCVDAKIKQAGEQLDEKFKGITESMSQVCKLLGKMQATAGIQEVRAKYPDFETFKADTVAVLKKYPMMEIEDAYLLAKQSRTGDAPAANETETERPTTTPFGQLGERPAEQAQSGKIAAAPEASHVSGVVAFRNTVNKAVDKLDIGKGR